MPPVAVTVPLYDAPTVPSGSDVVVMASVPDCPAPIARFRFAVAVWEVGYEMLEWLLIDGYRECLPPTPHVPMRFFLSGDPKQS